MRNMLVGITGLLGLATAACGAETMPLNQRAARSSPEWITRGVMYQIQPRAFTPEGTLKAATARLPQLADLGFDIIYLCPVFVADDDPDIRGWSPRQKKSGMNNPRNQYRMKDYYHVDPEYGTDDDLKAFIAESHKLKMRVLLDMVYLHCGPNAVFLAEHPNFVKRDAQGQVAVAAWGFPALNLADPELRESLWKNMEYWARDFGADGFRCDVADGVPLDFWEAARERLEKIRPDSRQAEMTCEMNMKTSPVLFLLAAAWVVAAMAAEPRCPLIPMGAITGKPDEKTVKETLARSTGTSSIHLAGPWKLKRWSSCTLQSS